jgi:hypothetical protein
MNALGDRARFDQAGAAGLPEEMEPKEKKERASV